MWGRDHEGIGGTCRYLTFSGPEKEPATLIPYQTKSTSQFLGFLRPAGLPSDQRRELRGGEGGRQGPDMTGAWLSKTDPFQGQRKRMNGALDIIRPNGLDPDI